MKSIFTTFCFLFLSISSYSQSSTEQEYDDYLAQLKVSHEATLQFYQDCDKTEEFEEEFNKMKLILDEIDIFISNLDENAQWLVKFESMAPDSGYGPLRIFQMYHQNSVLSPIEELKESQLFYVKLCSKMGAESTLKNEEEVKEIYGVYYEFKGVHKFYSDMSNTTTNYFDLLAGNIDAYTCEQLEEFESICDQIDQEIPNFKAYRDSTVAFFKALPEAHQQIRIPYNHEKVEEDLATDSETELIYKSISRSTNKSLGDDYSLFEEFMGLYAPLALEKKKYGDAASASLTIKMVKEYYPDELTERFREVINFGKDKKVCK